MECVWETAKELSVSGCGLSMTERAPGQSRVRVPTPSHVGAIAQEPRPLRQRVVAIVRHAPKPYVLERRHMVGACACHARFPRRSWGILLAGAVALALGVCQFAAHEQDMVACFGRQLMKHVSCYACDEFAVDYQ